MIKGCLEKIIRFGRGWLPLANSPARAQRPIGKQAPAKSRNWTQIPIPGFVKVKSRDYLGLLYSLFRTPRTLL